MCNPNLYSLNLSLATIFLIAEPKRNGRLLHVKSTGGHDITVALLTLLTS